MKKLFLFMFVICALAGCTKAARSGDAYMQAAIDSLYNRYDYYWFK